MKFFNPAILMLAVAAAGCQAPLAVRNAPGVVASASVEAGTANVALAKPRRQAVQRAAYVQPTPGAEAGADERPDTELIPPPPGGKPEEKEPDKPEADRPDDGDKPSTKEAPATAASATPPVVTLASLLHQAATANPEIAAARSRARSLMQRPPQVASLDDPMFSSTLFVAPVETAAGRQQGVFNLSQKLPWTPKLDARGGAAYQQAQAAFAELAGIELRIREETRIAYYDLYFVQQAAEVYRELQTPLKDLIEIIVARYESNDKATGRETILQAETRLDALQITIAKLDELKAKALARLSKATHLPVARLELATADLQATPSPAVAAELIARIESQHPDLEVHRANVKRDTWLRALACEDYNPDLTVGLSMIAIANQGISPVRNGNDAFALTFGFNLPVRNARRAAAVREANIKITESTQRLENQLATLRSQVQQWRGEIAAHDKVLEILNDRVIRNAQETFELSVEGYQVDRVTIQQLIANYEKVLQYRIERLTRITQREQAVARLERAMGISAAAYTCATTTTPTPSRR